MPDAPPEGCTALNVIIGDPEQYPWYPEFAEFCGTWRFQPYYRERAHPPPPPPPPPEGEPPPECVSLNLILQNPEQYPWYPGHAAYCGHWHNQQYYRETEEPPPGGNDPPEEQVAGRENQPTGDVDASEDSLAFASDETDDPRPFDPE